MSAVLICAARAPTVRHTFSHPPNSRMATLRPMISSRSLNASFLHHISYGIGAHGVGNGVLGVRGHYGLYWQPRGCAYDAHVAVQARLEGTSN